MYYFFSKPRMIHLPRARIWKGIHLFCACRHPSNWRHSGALVMDLSGSTPPITLRNTKIFYYLQLLRGIFGVMVRDPRIRDNGTARLFPLGVPIAWMLASKGTTNTITFFVNW